MKVLITGVSGFLGSKVRTMFAAHPGWEVWGLSRSGLISVDHIVALDITNEKATACLLSKLEPDLMIHCAALTGSDECERSPDLAHAVNVLGTLYLVRNMPGRFVLISTDYVFDGRRGSYSEADEPCPINLYGRTKLEAEEIVRKHCRHHIIVRTAGLYGYNHHGNNRFTNTLLSEGIEYAPVDLVSSPTLIDDVASILISMVQQGKVGLYHLTGPDPRSRYSFLCEAATALGASRIPLPTLAGHMGYLAPRPRDSSLVSAKLDRQLRDVTTGLTCTRQAMHTTEAPDLGK